MDPGPSRRNKSWTRSVLWSAGRDSTPTVRTVWAPERRATGDPMSKQDAHFFNIFTAVIVMLAVVAVGILFSRASWRGIHRTSTNSPRPPTETKSGGASGHRVRSQLRARTLQRWRSRHTPAGRPHRRTCRRLKPTVPSFSKLNATCATAQASQAPRRSGTRPLGPRASSRVRPHFTSTPSRALRVRAASCRHRAARLAPLTLSSNRRSIK